METTDYTSLAEMLYMVACYRRRSRPGKAIQLIQGILNHNSGELDPARKRILAVCIYNLAEIYEGIEPGSRVARDFYLQAAEIWNEIEPTHPFSPLSYIGAMQGMQEETERFILLGTKPKLTGKTNVA